MRNTAMKTRVKLLTCVIAIAGWYLVYPPAYEHSDSDPTASLSNWIIDGSYGNAAECDDAYYSDLNSMVRLIDDSSDFVQTQAGRCVPSDDLRLEK